VDYAMKQQYVDYDQIANSYNRRFEHEGPDGTRAALVEFARSINAQRILEVGCGTAHWLSAIQTDFGNETLLFGVDLSAGMLLKARQDTERINLIHACAEQLPIASHNFDMVYCLNAIHHFDDPRAFIQEARRLLRPGGWLAVIGTNPRGRRDRWYIYDYFPGTYKRDLDRFPSWGTIIDWVIECDFGELQWRLAEHIHDPKFGSEVLNDPFIEKNATSQLALLSDQEYLAGIDRINQAISKAQQENQVTLFRCDIYLYLLVAATPS
jgi:ubiquinone/menaquinone biosynthesis C-methylase UbiE